MYRKGIPASKIAAITRTAETTVRYHLQSAVRADPGLRDQHHAALTAPAPRLTQAGLRNLADVLAFHQAEGRPPKSGGKTARERALGAWLNNRRKESAAGTLSPTYRDGLAAIQGWDRPSTRKTDDETRWQQRLRDLQALRAAGGDWPRHQKTDDMHERTLGLWLHGQRMTRRAGKMNPAKEKLLDELLPGWREGRGHRGGRTRTAGWA